MKDLTWGPPLQHIYLRCCGGGRQSALTVETFLEAKLARGWGWGVNRNMVLSGTWDSPSHWWDLCYPLIFCFPLCVKLWKYLLSMQKKSNQDWREGGRGGGLTNLFCFCEHFNWIVLYFIMGSYLLLACVYGLVPAQDVYFSICSIILGHFKVVH